MSLPLIAHVWTTKVADAGSQQLMADVQTILGSNEFKQNITVLAGETAEIDCGSIDKTKIISMFLYSDVAVTVDTNAADATGGQEIPLAAKMAYDWNQNLPTACPITDNITQISF